MPVISTAEYGASDPSRYGVFVVNVGSDTTITWNPSSSDGDWDSEFDTVYYIGDNGTFAFKPDGVNSVTVQNIYGKTAGEIKNVTAAEDGTFEVPVTSGANIIAASTADGTGYLVVRAKQIHYTFTNTTTSKTMTDSAPEISTGDSVTVSLSGLDIPVPKMSGIYNPGYMGTAKTAYKLNGKYLLTSAGTQYDFAYSENGCSVTFVALVPGTNNLEGYISLSSMGDDFGNHRNTSDNGRAANTNASEKFGQFGILPDITFVVSDSGTLVSTQSVSDGDLVEFFFYEDEYYGDTYNWFTIEDGYSRSFSTTVGTPLELTLNGFFAMESYTFANASEMINSEDAFEVEDAQIYIVDTTTGAMTEISGAVTDEDGNVSLTFDKAGKYVITAYGTDDCMFTQLLSLTTINVESNEKVRVVVEKTSYHVSSGAPWEGTLVDALVALDEDSTMMSCMVKLLLVTV